MKVKYLAVVDPKRDIGVYAKIKAQIKSFNSAGIEASLVKVHGRANQLFGSYFTNIKYDWKKINIKKDVDALYIRYPMASFGFFCFLKKFKKEKKIGTRKIIIEIPTYPYNKEQKAMNFPVILKDKIFSLLLKRYVDRIATFSEDKYIFGIETITIHNGIDFDSVEEKKVINKPLNEIDMIAVATMKPWHGYERLIRGLGEYYLKGGSRSIKLHMVGEGPELKYYHELAKTYKLEKRVIFYGKKAGKELNIIYDRCDIGVLSLGTHRKNLLLTSELKSREYAAKGLSMIGACKCDIFLPQKYPYIFQFHADESNIPIKKLIRFYDNIYLNTQKKKEQIVSEIRTNAIQVCDVNVTMKPVINYFLKNI